MTLPASRGIPFAGPQGRESNFWFWLELITGIICLALYVFILGLP